MYKFTLITLLSVFGFADTFSDGKALFDKHCSSCHKGYISASKIKRNFFEMNNTLLNLKAPTVNMLAYAIMEGPKKIGDPEDDEMRQEEIAEYLKDYLKEPDLDESICDSFIMKFYAKKPPFKEKLKDSDYLALAKYFMEYKKRRLRGTQNSVKSLKDFKNEKQILKEAKQEGKNIIIEAESKNCHYCNKMKQEVIDESDVREILAKNFILVSVDIEKQRLPFNLQKFYKHITPSFFILDSNGKLLSSYPGSWTKRDFIEILKEYKPKDSKE